MFYIRALPRQVMSSNYCKRSGNCRYMLHSKRAVRDSIPHMQLIVASWLLQLIAPVLHGNVTAMFSRDAVRRNNSLTCSVRTCVLVSNLRAAINTRGGGGLIRLYLTIHHYLVYCTCPTSVVNPECFNFNLIVSVFLFFIFSLFTRTHSILVCM